MKVELSTTDDCWIVYDSEGTEIHRIPRQLSMMTGQERSIMTQAFNNDKKLKGAPVPLLPRRAIVTKSGAVLEEIDMRKAPLVNQQEAPIVDDNKEVGEHGERGFLPSAVSNWMVPDESSKKGGSFVSVTSYGDGNDWSSYYGQNYGE